MSGGATAAWVAAGIAAVGTAYSVYSGEENKKAQAQAQQQAKQNADRQASLADQAMNRENQKKPDTVGALAAAQQSGKSGASGTMLTGSQGIDPSALNLGKNTLLGS